MNPLIIELWKEEERIQQLLTSCRKIIKRAPTGRVQVSKCKNSFQYYICDGEKKTPKGRYVKKNELRLAKQLIEREYAEKLRVVCEIRCSEIKRLERCLKETEPEAVYNSLPAGKRYMIQSLEKSDEEFIREWESVAYNGKSFSDNYPEIYSDRGERVRSKTEKIIADKLYRVGIPYRYEEPLFLEGYGEVYPDFKLLNTRTREVIILEHLGLMDELTYVESAMRKLRLYEKNGYFIGKQLLITYETAAVPFDSRIFENMLKEMGF